MLAEASIFAKDFPLGIFTPFGSPRHK